MKLILKKSVENLGDAGAIVNVKAGFGRNYLLPQGLAYEASAANIRRLEAEQKLAEERSRRDYLEARRRASQITGLAFTFRARAGEDGKLFGSVTATEIADAIQAARGLKVDKKKIRLSDPIRDTGTYMVEVELPGGTTATVKTIVAEAK